MRPHTFPFAITVAESVISDSAKGHRQIKTVRKVVCYATNRASADLRCKAARGIWPSAEVTEIHGTSTPAIGHRR